MSFEKHEFLKSIVSYSCKGCDSECRQLGREAECSQPGLVQDAGCAESGCADRGCGERCCAECSCAECGTARLLELVLTTVRTLINLNNHDYDDSQP